MQHILMNKALLSYISYDFFWGLQFDPQKISKNNLGRAAEELLHNPAELQSIETFQREIYSKNIFIRAFYWIFNIGNYRINFYKLAALESYSGYRSKIGFDVTEDQNKPLFELTNILQESKYHQIHNLFFDIVISNEIVNTQNQDNKDTEGNVPISEEQSKTNLKKSNENHYGWILDCLDKPKNNAEHEKESADIVRADKKEDYLIVDEDNQFFLEFFGEDEKIRKKIGMREKVEIGEKIEIGKIISAFKIMALKTHPDKGGIGKDFQMIKDIKALLLRERGYEKINKFYLKISIHDYKTRKIREEFSEENIRKMVRKCIADIRSEEEDNYFFYNNDNEDFVASRYSL